MNNRVDRAFKLIQASPKVLYQAFLNAHDLIQWLPPEGMTGEVDYFDGQIGGEFKIILKYLDGDFEGKSGEQTDITKGTFVDLIPHSKITVEVIFESNRPEFQGTMTQEWNYEKRENGTMVSIKCSNVPEGISQEDHEAGLNSTLNHLDIFINQHIKHRRPD